ncbi:MAG TPA: hypothetical protein DCS93_16765 [Microscillaceae bacterium]|nr:hypothetical protein [Microscillaceae bacterium]
MGLLQPPVNEVYDLLSLHDAQELNKLKAKYKGKGKGEYQDYEHIFSAGIIAGEGEDDELLVRANLSLLGLKYILLRSKRLLPKLQKRIKGFNNIQLISQIIIAISGATLLTTFRKPFEPLTKIVVGALALTGSLLSIYVQKRLGNVALGEKSLAKLLNDLIDQQAKAEMYFDEMGILSKKIQLESATNDISQKAKDGFLTLLNRQVSSIIDSLEDNLENDKIDDPSKEKISEIIKSSNQVSREFKKLINTI